MKLSKAKLFRLKSGQTYWRVWAMPKHDGSGWNMSVEQSHVLGKRIHGEHGTDGPGFRCKRYPTFLSMPYGYFRMNFSEGLATFTKRKQADRFVREFLAGLQPASAKYAQDWADKCRSLSSRFVQEWEWDSVPTYEGY